MKLDYILMDTCLMGCVEVAYELRNKCDRLLFSPTEILSDGMVYTTMAALLTNVATPSLNTIAKEYFDHYQAQSGLYRSCRLHQALRPRRRLQFAHIKIPHTD